MASTAETGHAKNVANFYELISFCDGYGVGYNPSNEALFMDNLKKLHLQAAASLQQAIVTKTKLANATNTRKLVLKELKPLSTRIVNAFAASGASPLTIANVKTINRKIQGIKATGTFNTAMLPADAIPAIPALKTISASQQSFDNMISHFSKLIEAVSQDGSYHPNEIELKTATLKSKLAGLQAANKALLIAFTNWSNERITRNIILYKPTTGLIQIAQQVKKYVKAVYNASSAQFKQVGSIKFKAVHD